MYQLHFIKGDDQRRLVTDVHKTVGSGLKEHRTPMRYSVKSDWTIDKDINIYYIQMDSYVVSTRLDTILVD